MRFRLFTLFALALATSAGAAPPTPGITPDRILLGQSAKLSGNSGTQTGKQYRDGALLAFEASNRAGGINGRRIEMVSLDDQITPDRAAQNTRALIDDHQVFALVNYTFSNTVRAALPLAVEARVPFVGPYTGMPDLYGAPLRGVFVMRASFEDELRAVVRMIDTIGFDSVAIVQYSNTLGDELRTDLTAKLLATKRTLAGSASMPLNSADPTTAAAPAVQRMASICPSVVFLGVSGRDAATVVRGLRGRCAVDPRYFARGLVDIAVLAKELGPLAAGIMVTQVVPNPHRGTHPLVREYRDLLAKRAPGAEPDFAEFEGFISGRLIVQALRRTGRDLTRDGFVKAMEAERLDGPGHYRIEFSPGSHAGSRYVNIVMMSADGRITD